MSVMFELKTNTVDAFRTPNGQVYVSASKITEFFVINFNNYKRNGQKLPDITTQTKLLLEKSPEFKKYLKQLDLNINKELLNVT